MSIEKSPIVRQQEEKIADLQSQIKKKNVTVKSLKTRLENMRERIDELQRKARNSFAHVEQKMKERTAKITAILARLQKDKRFSKINRSQFKEMHEMIDGMVEKEQPFEEPDFDFGPGFEEERAKNFDPFAQFQVAPEPEVQQDIRKLYLKLSKRFHPDRAQNPKEQQLFHDIQQEIVRLYQAYDLQGLMNLAMQYDLNLLDFSESETDVLEQKIQLLTQQLSGLEQQQERLSAEIKNLRNSPLGQMLTDVDSFAKDGVDIMDVESMTGDSIEEMESYLEALEEVERTGSMTPLTEHENAHAYDNEVDFLADYFFDDDDDDDDYDDDPFGGNFYYTREVTDAKYPIGSWVKFEAVADHRSQPITVQGQVKSAYMDSSGITFYNIQASTDTLLKMTRPFIDKMLKLDSLGHFKGIPEVMISSSKAPSKEKIEARYEVLYNLWRKYAFLQMSAAKRKRIFKILDRNSEKPDHENWFDYIKEEITCPFRARVYEADEVIPENSPLEENYSQRQISVEVVSFTQNADTVSIKAITKDRDKRERVFFLHDLLPNMIHYRKLINEYREWHELYVETFLDL